jgi:hypothetical protein
MARAITHLDCCKSPSLEVIHVVSGHPRDSQTVERCVTCQAHWFVRSLERGVARRGLAPPWSKSPSRSPSPIDRTWALDQLWPLDELGASRAEDLLHRGASLPPGRQVRSIGLGHSTSSGPSTSSGVSRAEDLLHRGASLLPGRQVRSIGLGHSTSAGPSPSSGVSRAEDLLHRGASLLPGRQVRSIGLGQPGAARQPGVGARACVSRVGARRRIGPSAKIPVGAVRPDECPQDRSWIRVAGRVSCQGVAAAVLRRPAQRRAGGAPVVRSRHAKALPGDGPPRCGGRWVQQPEALAACRRSQAGPRGGDRVRR